MDNNNDINNSIAELQQFVGQPTAFQSIIILVASFIAVYWISHFITNGIVRVAQLVAVRTDEASDYVRRIRLRRIETYLSITVAIVRTVIVVVLGYVLWRILSPTTGSSIAAIGAGAVFVVVAGQTVGTILRDITAGATMIVEKWFNVGDHVKIESFENVVGVVERLTLRSTRLRTLSGEIVHIHNQEIKAVHVTPRGVRTIAVDIFVRDKTKGQTAIEKVMATIPNGPLLLAQPLRIRSVESWGEDLARITVVGQTAPGREWLIEKFFVNAIKEIDEDKKPQDRLIIHEPLARFSDPEADRRFKRAVYADKNKDKDLDDI